MVSLPNHHDGALIHLNPKGLSYVTQGFSPDTSTLPAPAY